MKRRIQQYNLLPYSKSRIRSVPRAHSLKPTVPRESDRVMALAKRQLGVCFESRWQICITKDKLFAWSSTSPSTLSSLPGRYSIAQSKYDHSSSRLCSAVHRLTVLFRRRRWIAGFSVGCVLTSLFTDVCTY